MYNENGPDQLATPPQPTPYSISMPGCQRRVQQPLQRAELMKNDFFVWRPYATLIDVDIWFDRDIDCISFRSAVPAVALASYILGRGHRYRITQGEDGGIPAP